MALAIRNIVPVRCWYAWWMQAGWVASPAAASINIVNRLRAFPLSWTGPQRMFGQRMVSLAILRAETWSTLAQHRAPSSNLAHNQRAGVLCVAGRMGCRRDL